MMTMTYRMTGSITALGLSALLGALVAVPAAAQPPVPPAPLLGPQFAREINDVARTVRDAVRDATRDARRWSDHYWEERQGPQQTERFSRTFKVGAAGVLDLSNISGTIVITGGAGEEMVIDAVKRVRAATSDEAKRQLASVTIDATERSGRVEVRTTYATDHIHGGSVDYTVTMPSGAAVFVRSVSGDVRVTTVKGEVRADSVSGNVVVSGAGPNLRAKSVSGDVTVDASGSNGDASLASVSGNVVARGLRARSVDANSVSGDLRLTDITCDRVNVRTMSGEVDYDGPLSKGGRYEMRSHSGNVRLVMAGATGFEVDASTFSGTFRSDFPVTLRSMGGESRGDRHGDRRGGSVQGTYGDGSAVLVLGSFSGNIVITKR
jgi:DUF4097 and DUF4098 domain-containing protein YvlB